MPLVRCKCGRNTQNGFLCTNCQKDSSIDTFYYEPEDTEDEFDEEGFTVVDIFEEDEEEDD